MTPPHIATTTAGTGMGDTTTLKNRRSALPNRGRAPTDTPCHRWLVGGQTARTMLAPPKKKPPTGTQPRRRHVRGQTARLGSQHTHKRKSAVAESSTTRSYHEVENPATGVGSRYLVEQTPMHGAPTPGSATQGSRLPGTPASRRGWLGRRRPGRHGRPGGQAGMARPAMAVSRTLRPASHGRRPLAEAGRWQRGRIWRWEQQI